ncbi:MAG: glycosyltransferase family 4 protein [Clostridium sp.]|uniref:glycosyltransferase family 4 protein n=1 Tax=Clostridium sp. TaxID=1506 RepID=UPI00290E8986|nr:glycosyltransferase family 4 protein [Clostridium sp.]MDU5110364.1 glycosyltransferase family 4 protein [Clostridium sp.]
MNIAFVTNIRAPYRILQFNEFAKIDNINFTAYYTHKERENREWEAKANKGYKEIYLEGINLFEKYGYINKGLYNLVKSNDIIIIGGYEQPTYILISILCRIIGKPYIISFDGISTNRINNHENKIKKILKGIVIKNSDYILGNGKVSKRYFNEIFDYSLERIYNQYLTVDGERINKLYKFKEELREEYRKKYNISSDEKVLIYSGRIIDIKNIDSVIKAINRLNKSDITLLIAGGGGLENQMKELASKLNVRMIITGFITKQEELFKHYFLADTLILPSIYEPWGLVVNEAMFAGLPVIVSEICGCSLDLVFEDENGSIINPNSIDNISNSIEKILYNKNKEKLSIKSREIISEWTFQNSKKSLEKVIKNINSEKRE